VNQEPPSHADLLEAIAALRADIAPLLEVTPEIKEMVEVMQAVKVGGKGVKWIASIATALLTIGGLMLAVRAMWQSYWGTAA
jgi:hypothetical protein